MYQKNLKKMNRGWFVGNFDPSILQTDQCEVAVKNYTAGESEPRHYHKIATEITVIVDGSVRMNGKNYEKGDIILIEPGESTDFQALTDTTTTVVKVPSVTNDKYLSDE